MGGVGGWGAHARWCGRLCTRAGRGCSRAEGLAQGTGVGAGRRCSAGHAAKQASQGAAARAARDAVACGSWPQWGASAGRGGGWAGSVRSRHSRPSGRSARAHLHRRQLLLVGRLALLQVDRQRAVAGLQVGHRLLQLLGVAPGARSGGWGWPGGGCAGWFGLNEGRRLLADRGPRLHKRDPPAGLAGRSDRQQASRPGGRPATVPPGHSPQHADAGTGRAARATRRLKQQAGYAAREVCGVALPT